MGTTELTATMLRALRLIREMDDAVRRHGIPKDNTIIALENRGLIQQGNNWGSVLTPAGRAALEELEK